MKNTDSLAENVLEKSEKEIELVYHKIENFDIQAFFNFYYLNKDDYQCHAYFFNKEKDASENIIDATVESVDGLLKANIALKPKFGHDCLVVWKNRCNFVICGKYGKEIEPLCVLSPRTSSVPWSGLRFMAISDIARQEGLEYYGYDKHLTIINLKRKEKDGRKGILLSEGSATIESILQQ